MQENRQPRRNPRSRHRRGRKKGWSFWQYLVVLVLFCCTLFAFFRLTDANEQLRGLLKERQRVMDEYDNLVSRHKNLIRYQDYIEYYSAYYELNPAFVAALIYRESHYDPMAVSNVGAQGLMQLMPDTVEWMADKLNIENPDPHVPETNIRMGTRYLNYLSGKFDGNPIYVACSFHAGAGNVESWIEKGYFADPENPQIDEIPMDDSQHYARKVIESYAVYLQHYYPVGGASSGADVQYSLRAGH